MGPRILTFTSLFPDAEHPMRGVFVRERIRALAAVCPLEVVAPVQWVPPIALFERRYGNCRRVPRFERDASGVAIHHPRFAVVPKLLKRLDGLLMGAACVDEVARIRRSFPFDLIDAHWAYPDGVAASFVAQRAGVPFTVTVRGDDINVFAEEPARGPQIRRMLARAALVIAVSEDLKARVEQLTGGRATTVVVPNGVDGTRFRPADRLAARQRLGLPMDRRVCVSVGRLHDSKRFPLLVDALARLPAGCGDVELFVIGAPDPEADARAAIAERISHHNLHDRVHVVGAQTPDQLVDWYNAADLYCSATIREGSPNVILEAMACGLPCVTTPVGGNREAVASADVGLLAPSDPVALGDALAAALTRSWNRAHIAERARRRTWSVVAGECREALGRVVPHAS